MDTLVEKVTEVSNGQAQGFFMPRERQEASAEVALAGMQ